MERSNGSRSAVKGRIFLFILSQSFTYFVLGELSQNHFKIISQDSSMENARSCEFGDAVFIQFTGRKAADRDDNTGVIFQEVTDWLIVLGDKDVTPALEMAVRFMQEGDTGFVFSKSRFAYGPLERRKGKCILPPNSDVSYEVKIKKLVKSDNILFSPEFQIEISLSKKVIGNDAFQCEWSNGNGKQKIINLYKKAAEGMMNLLVESEKHNDKNKESHEKRANEILIDCLNNVTAVYLKAKEYKEAKEAATEVLLRDRNNFKALLRAARAAIYDLTGTFEESEAALKAAESVNPGDKDVQRLKLELEHRRKRYKKEQKKLLSKMSVGISTSSTQRPTKESISGTKKDVNESARSDETSETLQNEKLGWNKQTRFILQFLVPFVLCYFVFIQDWIWKNL